MGGVEFQEHTAAQLHWRAAHLHLEQQLKLCVENELEVKARLLRVSEPLAQDGRASKPPGEADKPLGEAWGQVEEHHGFSQNQHRGWRALPQAPGILPT